MMVDMSYKKDKTFYLFLIKIFLVIAFAGVALLVYASLQDDPSDLAFSLIAFVVSVTALIMTTLQSLSIARQLSLTRRAAELVHETSERLETLVAEDKKLGQEVRRDITLDHEIIAALEELGIGATDDERKQVASHITKRVGK